MVSGLPLLLIISFAIVFIVIACSRFKWHPFLALLIAALFTGLAVGLPLKDIALTANEGFGNMMTHIGLVVVLGTLIGTVLEKSGATLCIADAIIRFFGKDKPVLAITVIGTVVGIPIFCDSGFVILNGLTKPLSRESKKSYTAIVNGLAGGLYITHTLLPPHPGSLAGAANLGLGQHLGTVILTGLLISIPATIMCWLFASRFLNKINKYEAADEIKEEELFHLPALWKSILPVIVPVLLIAAGSAAELFTLPAMVKSVLVFFGSPVIALLMGLIFSLLLVKEKGTKLFNSWMVEAISHAGPILILVGAGGVFGNVLKKTPLAELVHQWVSSGSFSPFAFLLIAYAVGCLLKTAQGSTTSAIIVATSILAPIAFIAGFKEPLQLSLLLSATAAGAMMVSHANDAYFWVIAQFSGLTMQETYRSFSLLSIVLSVASLVFILLLALVMI
jgi:gluconate:H+ symporter, GntP family